MQTENKKPIDKNKTAANNSPKSNEGKNKEVTAAHEEALSDIEEDPDFSMRSPNDDLDEGETARLGEDKTDII